MKNTVTLVGFVGNNPELRETQSGARITTFSLATTRGFKGTEGNRQTETEWHWIANLTWLAINVSLELLDCFLLALHDEPQQEPILGMRRRQIPAKTVDLGFRHPFSR